MPTTVNLVPLFAKLSGAAAARVNASLTVVTADKGTELVREEERADAVYFILSGFAKVVRGSGARRYAIAVLGPGDIFGELGAITGQSRNATVLALSSCTVARLERTTFLEILDTEPSIQLFLLRYLAQRIIDADQQIELFRGEVVPRLKFWLARLKERGLNAPIALTNAEIARLAGTSREGVSRTVSRLRRGTAASASAAPVSPDSD